VSARHDDLLEALLGLQGLLEARDAIAAETATARVLQLLASATEPARDPRLRPVFATCQQLADALKASLQGQLHASATSSRATQAYEREVGEGP
jgi:hypothetical protein